MTPEARAEFFATGEADVAHLFDLIGPGFAPVAALDFGCGVGRLTRALAQRVSRVAGVDISPTMITRARENVPQAEFSTEIPDDRFDLIVSLIVLQHIPVPEGMRLIARLLERLRPNGVIALQVATGRRGSAVRRMARRVRGAFPLVHRLAALVEGARALPYMEMNVYELDRIYRELSAAGCVQVVEETTNHGGIEGRLLIARKVHSV